jgi:hypothetical protein
MARVNLGKRSSYITGVLRGLGGWYRANCINENAQRKLARIANERFAGLAKALHRPQAGRWFEKATTKRT